MSVEFPKGEIRKTILLYISGTALNISPLDLVRIVSTDTGLKRVEVQSTVRSMVDEGILEYRDKNGRTRVALSFNRPVRLSPHVMVAPPGLKLLDTENCVAVTLNSGTAFGRGDHPTTQLCVEALDCFLWENKESEKEFRSALDIGTGSGILAIAAAKLGVQQVFACDRDGVALNEARENRLANNLGDHIHIVDNPDMGRRYDMIIANLRYPTLIDLYPHMVNMTESDNILVLSGIKETEMEIVHSIYQKNGHFFPVWSRNKNGWSGVVYKKQ